MRLRPLCFVSLFTLTACTQTLNIPEFDSDHSVAFVSEGEALEQKLQRVGETVLAPPVSAQGQSFDRIGIRFSSVEALEVQVRLSDDGARSYGSWHPMRSIFFEEGFQIQLFDIETTATDVQVRFLTDDVSTIEFMALELFHYNAEPEASAQVEATPSQSQQALATNAVAGSDWGRRTRTASCGSVHSPSRITVHHTVTPNNDTRTMPSRLRSLEKWMVEGRGWCGMGYHYIVGQDGLVYEGRRESRTGAHASGANTNNVGISFMGNFQEILPSDEMLDAAAIAIADIAERNNIPLDRDHVKGHREVGTTVTSCPGESLFENLETLIALAKGDEGNEVVNTGPASCTSQTLGQLVEHDTCVQIDYAACGLERCAFLRCQDGFWECSTELFCNVGQTEVNAACEVEVVVDDEPNDTSCEAGLECLGDAFPFVISGDTREGTRRFDSYDCAPGTNESGPEIVYRVATSNTGTLSARLNPNSLAQGVDVDVHVLSANRANACLARGHFDASAEVEQGYVYVVVDTWVSSSAREASGAFEIEIAFEPDATVVEDDVSNDDCSVDGCVSSFPSVLSGTTVGGARNFDRYACSTSSNESGPERVYEVEITEPGYLHTRVDDVPGDSTDVDIHLLSALDANACLQRGNVSAGNLVNPGRYFVVVDSWTSSSGQEFSGEFKVEFVFSTQSMLTNNGLSPQTANAAFHEYAAAKRAGYARNSTRYTVVDYSLASYEERLFTIDMSNGALLYSTYVSHGEGSQEFDDPAYARHFSNTPGSRQSSLGMAESAETQNGASGYALVLDGIQVRNSNMRSRGLVLMGAWYADQWFLQQEGYLGMSEGSLAVSTAHHREVIDLIGTGSLVFSFADE